jgi:hypothetical protein
MNYFNLIVLIILVLLFIFDNCTNNDNNDNNNEYYSNINNDYYNYSNINDYYKINPNVNINKNILLNPFYKVQLSQMGLLPFWNSTRNTRNMSYDLRGDVPIQYFDVGPWLNSPRI